jgi:hypothetical protein
MKRIVSNVKRTQFAETVLLTVNLLRHKALAAKRDFASRRMYVVASAAALLLMCGIFGGTIIGVRAIQAANASGLLFSIAAWAFLVYLFTDIFIAFGQALNDLYLSTDMPMLLVTPVRPQSLIVAKFMLGVAQNLIYVGVFLLPFVLGYLIGTGAPWWAYPMSLAGLALFPVVLYAGLATITIVALRVMPARNAREGLWLIGAIVPVIFWLVSFARLQHIEGGLAALQLPAPPAWLPSTWVGDLLGYAAAGDAMKAFGQLGLTALVALIGCPLALAAVSLGFAEGWSRSTSSNRMPRLGPIAAIVWKDLSVVARSPQLWFNHLASLGFIGYLLVGTHSHTASLLPLTVQLAMLQIGYVAVLDAISPGMTALSLERASAKMLFCSPLTPKQMFAAKIASAYLQTAGISIAAALVSGIGYHFGIGEIAALLVFALLMAACATCFGVAFDTRFPSFDWENPNSLNRGVRMIVPFLAGLVVLAANGVFLGITRMVLGTTWNGFAALLVGLLLCAMLATVIALRTSRQAVRNIAALQF